MKNGLNTQKRTCSAPARHPSGYRHPVHGMAVVALALGGLATGLAGCASTAARTEVQPVAVATQSAGKPISLFGNDKSNAPAATRISVKAAIRQVAINRSIKNYQVSKKLPPSPFRTIGADLNGDGKAEALVYFTGKDWCTLSGCTLVIFTPVRYGYKPMSVIRRVKAPVKVSGRSTIGWRNLIVVTGGGRFEQTVTLPFNGSRYPGNAALMQKIAHGADIDAELLIPASANPAFTSLQAADTGENKAPRRIMPPQ